MLSGWTNQSKKKKIPRFRKSVRSSGRNQDLQGDKLQGEFGEALEGGRGGGREVSVGVELPGVLMIPVGKLGHCWEKQKILQSFCGGKVGQRPF